MRRRWPTIFALIFLMAFLFAGCGGKQKKKKSKGPSANSRSVKNRDNQNQDDIDALQDAIDDLKDAQDDALAKALRDNLARQNDPGLGGLQSPGLTPSVTPVPPGGITPTPVPPGRRPGIDDPTGPPRRAAERRAAEALRSQLESATHGSGEFSPVRRRAE